MAICPRKGHGGLAGVIVERRWNRGQSPSQMRAHHRTECGRAAHNLRAEYLRICGVIAEDTSTLLSLAPCSSMQARGCRSGPQGARLLAFH